MHPRLSRLRNLVLTATALLALGVARVAAGPDGANVVGGAAAIQGQGGPSVTITQSTPSAIINWRTFNIGSGENVRFNQPSSSSVALNRITGGLGPSEILGTLTANGRVFIINRDGVLFGPGAVVNTAGFLATTSDIKNSDFMAGRYNFNIPVDLMPRSSTRAASPQRAAASPRWWRRGCATPAPSRRRSAWWRSPRATASPSTCTATS
jgi:filamentous hemagglutinin family protein